MPAVSSRSLWASLSSVGREAARIVLPSWCVVCSEELPWRARRASCCERCWRELPRLGLRCTRCAIPLRFEQGREDLRCIDCSQAESPLAWIESWGEYRAGLERVIHAFKFERHDFLGAPLGGLLAEAFEARGDLEFDCVAFVPMHRRKLRERGYNQADLLARAFSRLTGLPVRRDILRKERDNSSQSTLPRAERSLNVRSTFSASPRADDLSILLIDDICTTGETLRACARELRRRKARRVCALTVARA